MIMLNYVWGHVCVCVCVCVCVLLWIIIMLIGVFVCVRVCVFCCEAKYKNIYFYNKYFAINRECTFVQEYAYYSTEFNINYIHREP